MVDIVSYVIWYGMLVSFSVVLLLCALLGLVVGKSALEDLCDGDVLGAAVGAVLCCIVFWGSVLALIVLWGQGMAMQVVSTWSTHRA